MSNFGYDTHTHTQTHAHVVLANCAWRCHLVVGTGWAPNVSPLFLCTVARVWQKLSQLRDAGDGVKLLFARFVVVLCMPASCCCCWCLCRCCCCCLCCCWWYYYRRCPQAMFMIIFMLLCVTLLRSYVMLFPLLEHILSMLCAYLAQPVCLAACTGNTRALETETPVSWPGSLLGAISSLWLLMLFERTAQCECRGRRDNNSSKSQESAHLTGQSWNPACTLPEPTIRFSCLHTERKRREGRVENFGVQQMRLTRS